MRPSYHAHLVNGDGGDPVLYVDSLLERRALLFDAGDLAALSPRKLLRISDVFISHTHLDHFAGLDLRIRMMLGRDKRLALCCPSGLIAQTAHKLAAYTWNLAEHYRIDFTLRVTELHHDGTAARAELRLKHRFRCDPLPAPAVRDGVLVDEPALRVRAALLDHNTPCLGYALEERQHVNIWKNRLEARGLAVGAWLRPLKQAVLAGAGDATPIAVEWRAAAGQPRHLPLGELREVLRVVPGRKIAYVVDAAYHAANAERIVALAAGADHLFIEAGFLDADAAEAARRHHLTARQAGGLARRAGVARLTPLHFSPRYQGCTQALRAEAAAAFAAAARP